VIVESLRVVDAVLKVDTPSGPVWRRYNHDGYGQRADGASFKGWGVGRPWPILTGERGHYELAAGRDARPYVRALERFAVGVGLIPEQIWDQPTLADKRLFYGGPTGAALPLVWAHAEYIKLVRSVADGRVFDRLEPVWSRYAGRQRPSSSRLEVWKARRQVASIAAGSRLRIVAGGPFDVTFATAGAAATQAAASTSIGVWYADIDAAVVGTLRFTIRTHAGDAILDGEHGVTVTPPR